MTTTYADRSPGSKAIVPGASRRKASPAAPRGSSRPGHPVGREAAAGLRVALFSGNYNCIGDGANNALNRLVAYLLAEGAAVRVYSPTAAPPAFEPQGDLVSVPSIAFPRRPEYRLALGLPRRVRDDIRRFAPTLFHLSAPDPLGYRAQAFGRELGLPVVASLHTRFETYFDYYGVGFLRRAAERYLGHFYRNCDQVLAPNAELASGLAAWGVGDRVAIWSRGVDRQLFSPRWRSLEWRRANGYTDDEAVVLFFGRVVREKGLDAFARTIAELRADGTGLRPLIVGDGPGRPAFAAALGDACFTGRLEGPALATAIASADVLLNPSTTEAFGNVNLEAMACGLTVVSADVPSARALIENGRTGLLVKPDEDGGYARAVEQARRHPLLRQKLGHAATAAASRYDWNSVLADVVAAYRRVGGCPAEPAAKAVAAGAIGRASP